MKTSKTFNEVVNFENGEITVLDEVFEYSNDMKGACGYILEPVSREDYEDAVTFEHLVEYLMDACNEVPEEFMRGGFEEWANAIWVNGEAESVFFDESYCSNWDKIRDACGLDEDEAYIFNCVGGGRIFSANYQGNMNPEMSEIIRKYEA